MRGVFQLKRIIFTGLAALLAPVITGDVCAEKFCLIVIPDTQVDVMDAEPHARYLSRFNWMAENKAARNIKYVCHVGDLVNWYTPWSTPVHSQLYNADKGFDILDAAGIPYAICVGNHDTYAVGGRDCPTGDCSEECIDHYNGGAAACGDVHANLRRTQPINDYFPVSRFTNCKGVYEQDKMDNIYQTFSAGGCDWLVITLELDPRQGAVDWAKGIVEAHPDHNVIVVTHNHLHQTGVLSGGVGYGDLNPTAVWQQLLEPYANVRFIFNGHVANAGFLESTGAHGNPVYHIMFGHQTYSYWNGWIRILEIDTENNSFVATTYSDYLKEWKTGDVYEYTVTGCEFIPSANPEPEPGPDPDNPSPENVTVSGNVLNESSDRVRFEGVAANTELRIYTLSGELVASLNESDFGGGAIDWNGINSNNVDAKPGIYLYVLACPDGSRKSGKVVVK